MALSVYPLAQRLSRLPIEQVEIARRDLQSDLCALAELLAARGDQLHARAVRHLHEHLVLQPQRLAQKDGAADAARPRRAEAQRLRADAGLQLLAALELGAVGG